MNVAYLYREGNQTLMRGRQIGWWERKINPTKRISVHDSGLRFVSINIQGMYFDLSLAFIFSPSPVSKQELIIVKLWTKIFYCSVPIFQKIKPFYWTFLYAYLKYKNVNHIISRYMYLLRCILNKILNIRR